MFKGLLLFYEKGQAGETPHSPEFLFEIWLVANFSIFKSGLVANFSIFKSGD